MTRKAFLLLTLLLVSTVASAQKRQLTLDDLYDPAKKVNFSGNSYYGLAWYDAGSYAWPKRDAKGKMIEAQVVDLKTGKARPLYDGKRFQSALEKEAAITTQNAAMLSMMPPAAMTAKGTASIVSSGGDLYLHSFDTGKVTRLTFTPAEEDQVTFSPDGSMIAFVRDHDLYTLNLATNRERRLTTTGDPQHLNGILDWVYEEEIYGRGNNRGYWWSPDSKKIAFLSFDETPVPEYPVVDHIPYAPVLENTDYPKPGDPNPLVKLMTVAAAGGEVQEMGADRYTAADLLIVAVDWTPDSSRVVYQAQNREQTWLDLDTADADDGSVTRLFRDSTKAWIEPTGNPVWLADGTFLWLSERSGWKHVYHYKADGSLMAQVTNGEWEVHDLYGADKNGWIYFSATERDPIGQDIYRVKVDGTGLQRLSEAAGTHRATFSPDFSSFIDVWSDPTTPSQVRLYGADGKLIRVLDENKVPALDEFVLSKPEFVQVPTRDGFLMEAMILKPANFDPTKKYPVYQETYSGPHSPMVRRGWAGAYGMFNQLVAQKGIIVWVCDNRTASGKGAVSTWPLYKQFGDLELRDLEDGMAWLAKQPWVDSSRTMLYGWSYGGFMTSYAMTHSKVWKSGIAGGTVSDWRDYDSVYTERYLLTPQNNPEGYRKSSPRFAAENLTGNLLLIHGLMDDNVHVANTIQFAYDLDNAGKQYRMMLYPKSRHGVREPKLVKHLQQLMLDYIVENLKP